MAQLLLSLDFMNQMSIIHRDLKPENVLLNSKDTGVYDVRIADFGFAIKADSKELGIEIEEDVICGTPGYIAPEALAGDGFTYKSDIFSLGSILYNILSLKNLFTGKDHHAVMLKNEECQLDHVEYHLRRHSPLARNLVMLLLAKDPSKRPTA